MNDVDQVDLIQQTVESAVDEICECYKKDGGNRPTVFARIFNMERQAFRQINQLPDPPEKFVKNILVWPVLSTLGYTHNGAEKIADKAEADFVISNTRKPIIGEVKKIGHIYEARGQILRYFDASTYEYGIITDGLYWELIKSQKNPGIASGIPLEQGDLRGIVANYTEQNDLVDSNIINLSSSIPASTPDEFYSSFCIDHVNGLL